MSRKQPTAEPASKGNFWDHRWGFADTRFVVNQDRSVTLTGERYILSGYKMHGLLPYVESALGIHLDLQHPKTEMSLKPVPAPNKSASFCQAVEKRFASEQYSFDDRIRLLHSHGQTTSEEVCKVLYSQIQRAVDMVFYCQSDDDAVQIVAMAQEHDVCLVPFGGGTSVSCALKLPRSETRMIVSVDMRRMDAIEWVDKDNYRACAQAGITGSALEEGLSKYGFISGHEPDSMELSTLGGWIATNASGMKKNRYGNIEHIVENITMITPAGKLEQRQTAPRASLGMQPQHLLFGSEGNLGLITKAIIKIHPTPEIQKYGSLVFPTFEAGVRFLKVLAGSGFVPASIRLVDNTQFRFGQALKPEPSGVGRLLGKIKKLYILNLRRFDPAKMVAATILMEGSRKEVRYQETNIYALARQFQGLSGGAESGQQGYLLTFAIAYIRDFLADFHVIGETFETSASWSDIHVICREVKLRLQKEHKKHCLPGKPYFSCRITQIYRTGVCIYFMFGVYTKGVERAEEIFAQIEHALRQTIIDNGGSISHHHGVGKIRKDFMGQTLSDSNIGLLMGVKKANDPHNVFGIRNNVLSE